MRLWKLIALLAALPLVPALASESESCSYCHDVMKKPFLHEAAIFDCTTCHYTHDETPPSTGGRPFARLKAPINELCLQCHDAKKLNIVQNRGHIITNHPIAGPKDPVYPNTPYSCASCHDPHSASQETLIRYEVKGTVYERHGLCSVCHTDTVFDSRSRPPKLPWR